MKFEGEIFSYEIKVYDHELDFEVDGNPWRGLQG